MARNRQRSAARTQAWWIVVWIIFLWLSTWALSPLGAQDADWWANYYGVPAPFDVRLNPSWLRPPDKPRDNGFVMCRLWFQADRSEPHGNGWGTDYPLAERNFMERLVEMTKVRPDTRTDYRGRVEGTYYVVRPDSPDLFLCPYAITSDVGVMNLTADQAQGLHTWMLKGGTLWVDDFWGQTSWDQWLRELGKIFSEGYVITTPSFMHPIYNSLYATTETLQVTNQPRWQSQQTTTEQDAPVTPLQVIEDDKGYVMVIMTHNSDIQDTWERDGATPEFTLTFSPDGYALGMNVLLYLMSH